MCSSAITRHSQCASLRDWLAGAANKKQDDRISSV
jgi:hypothetical protein